MQRLTLVGVCDAKYTLEAGVAQVVLVAKDGGARDATFGGEIVGEEGDEVEEAAWKCIMGTEV
jgi:hypothetical protein